MRWEGWSALGAWTCGRLGLWAGLSRLSTAHAAVGKGGAWICGRLGLGAGLSGLSTAHARGPEPPGDFPRVHRRGR